MLEQIVQIVSNVIVPLLVTPVAFPIDFLALIRIAMLRPVFQDTA